MKVNKVSHPDLEIRENSLLNSRSVYRVILKPRGESTGEKLPRRFMKGSMNEVYHSDISYVRSDL